jgi:glycine/D-amino acid oxidase-like deaminating enzyme
LFALNIVLEQQGIFKIIKRKVDYIIVGQGLAGSTLALQLIERGKEVMVFDEPLKNQCSRIAAGLYNPITGMGIVKTWLAEEVFASLIDFYSRCERLMEQKFLFPKFLYRPFNSIEEQNNWMAKSGENSVGKFVKQIFTTTTYGHEVQDPFGGIVLQSCGYLDTQTFLESTRKLLIEKGFFQEANFNNREVVHTVDYVSYKNLRAKKIIFSGGISANPFFDWLLIRPLKGETLTVRLEIEPSQIFNRGIYLVPTSRPSIYKAGATYELKDLTSGITEKGRNEIEAKLAGLLSMPFEVIGQEWGIRPTTIDRRPMLGEHPNQKNLVIFNGLGTKGVSLAPYFSAQLADWLEGRGEIMPEVNIKRFNALYSKS